MVEAAQERDGQRREERVAALPSTAPLPSTATCSNRPAPHAPVDALPCAGAACLPDTWAVARMHPDMSAAITAAARSSALAYTIAYSPCAPGAY